jgi:hypothetical protein
VPLCRTHHRALHRSGDEAAWWKSTDLDPVLIAHRLWQHTRLNGAPIKEHIDPFLSAPSVHGVDVDRSKSVHGTQRSMAAASEAMITGTNLSTPPIDPKTSDRTSQPDRPPTGCHQRREFVEKSPV